MTFYPLVHTAPSRRAPSHPSRKELPANSLLSNVPTTETCLLVKERLEQDLSLDDRTSLSPDQIHNLLLICVSSSCFQADSWELHGISPFTDTCWHFHGRVRNLFSPQRADLQPSLWLCYMYKYVDDTFVVWPHGRNALHDFLQHLNEQHSSIKFIWK